MTQKKCPTFLKVGPYEYEIFNDELEMLRASKDATSLLNGTCDSDNLQIRVNPNMALGMQQETLLHETLHAIFRCTTLPETMDPKEEEIVRAFTPFLLMVLRENPGLLKFILT